MNKLYLVNGEKNVKRLDVINVPFDESELDYIVNILLTTYNSSSYELKSFINTKTDETIDNSKVVITYPIEAIMSNLHFELNTTNKFKPSIDVLNYIKNLFT